MTVAPMDKLNLEALSEAERLELLRQFLILWGSDEDVENGSTVTGSGK